MPGAPGRAAYLAYRAGADLARVVPPRLARPLARGISQVMLGLQARRRRCVRDHLRRVSGGRLRGRELRRATSAVFEHYGRYWLDLFRARPGHDGSLEGVVSCDGYEHLESALADGRGAILALPHLGSWDLAGAWLAGRGHRITVVAERVQPPELYDWFVRRRAEIGLRVIGLDDAAVPEVLRALRGGGIVCLVCDRDLSGTGVPVELFGAMTTMPGGPALLALRTGAALLPTGTYQRPDGGCRIRIQSPVPAARRGPLRDDVGEVTQSVADRFEELIAAAPEQWLVLQPVWRESAVTT